MGRRCHSYAHNRTTAFLRRCIIYHDAQVCLSQQMQDGEEEQEEEEVEKEKDEDQEQKAEDEEGKEEDEENEHHGVMGRSE